MNLLICEYGMTPMRLCCKCIVSVKFFHKKSDSD